jgi:hypothetical protein
MYPRFVEDPSCTTSLDFNLGSQDSAECPESVKDTQDIFATAPV